MLFADTLVKASAIYTLEERLGVAQAMAVRGDRVVAVGTWPDVEGLGGAGTRVVDLGSRCVIPGMIDSHLHLLGFGLTLGRVDLRDTGSLDEALGLIGQAAGDAAPDEWVVCGGWDRNRWPRLPSARDIDSAVPDRPVLVRSKDGHAAWVNSLALSLSGVGRETPDPGGGELVRDPATGSPTGVLLENAVGLVWSRVPEPGDARCDAAITRALEVAASRGLTGVQSFEGRATLSSLQRLRARDELILRVTSHLPKDGLDDAISLGLSSGFGDEWVRIGHLKLFLDGALGSQTAHMLEPYAGTDNRGIAVLSEAELEEFVVRASKGGFAPAIHAIGDAANRVALDVLERTSERWRAAGLHPRIEHVQLLHATDLPRLGRLGVIASMQPIHAMSDWPVAERYWGDRASTAYAWRSLLETGAPLAFGSDCPVETIDPLLGIHAAVTRQRPDGQPPGGWYPDQRLAPLEGLGAYTRGAAHSTGEESIKGSLSPGKLADFVVLSEDPFAAPDPGEALLRTSITATVVGGRLAHGDI